MDVVIREADIKSDRDLLVDALCRFLNPLADARRFDWLYYNNPHGLARSWLALEAEGGSIVGVASAFPRRIFIGEKKEVAWVLGDFCINNNYRSLGPALKLQRSCLDAISSGGGAFWYDLPNPGMTAVYRRLQIEPFGSMVRLARPIRVDASIGRIVENAALARGLSAAGNCFLRLRDSFAKRTNRKLSIAIHRGDCGNEFTRLASEVGSRNGICTQRSAEYLNWRYLYNAYCRHHVMTARLEGILVAYAIYNESDGHAILADLFGIDDQEVIGCLIEELVAMLRRQNISLLSAPMYESHPWLPLLQRFGFWMREGTPVMRYPLPAEIRANGRRDDRRWFLTHGDRDS
jgi:hypothetical protein